MPGPVRLDKAFVLDVAEGQPARLVLDLVATDRASFMRSLALGNRPAAQSASVKPSEPPPKPDGDARPLVVLDPGHGGIDAAQGDQAENSKKMSCSPSHRHCARSWCSGKLASR